MPQPIHSHSFPLIMSDISEVSCMVVPACNDLCNWIPTRCPISIYYT